MRTLISPIFNRVGFESRGSDTHLDLFLRTEVIAWACSLEIPECVEKATSSFERWMAQVNPDSEGANP